MNVKTFPDCMEVWAGDVLLVLVVLWHGKWCIVGGAFEFLFDDRDNSFEYSTEALVVIKERVTQFIEKLSTPCDWPV